MHRITSPPPVPACQPRYAEDHSFLHALSIFFKAAEIRGSEGRFSRGFSAYVGIKLLQDTLAASADHTDRLRRVWIGPHTSPNAPRTRPSNVTTPTPHLLYGA